MNPATIRIPPISTAEIVLNGSVIRQKSTPSIFKKNLC